MSRPIRRGGGEGGWEGGGGKDYTWAPPVVKPLYRTLLTVALSMTTYPPTQDGEAC